MACNVTLADITYSCDDVAIGGIVQLFLTNKATLVGASGALDQVASGAVVIDNDARTISDGSTESIVPIAVADGIEIGFNNKDAFSVFSEVKTVSADGVVSCVPTIAVELPKMTPSKVTELNRISKGGAELVAIIETAAGTYHVVGLDYGLYAGTVDGNSGTGRSEKNRFQLTLTGDELGLGYSLEETGTDGGKAKFTTLVSLIQAP
tara:strand:- start:515 stop:1135 length:621 start_codon:yes stop_codon:yes gene_type:complete